MVDKNFIGLDKPDITRFESYLPTAFSSELTLLQKVNKIVQELNRSFDLNNEMVEYLNNFVETFDEKLYGTLDDVLNVWLNNDKLTKLLREVLNEKEMFYSIQALYTKYPNGAQGVFLVFDTTFSDGAHSFIWSQIDSRWVDNGAYNKDYSDLLVKEVIASYNNYLPSNEITDNYLTGNQNVSSVASILSVVNKGSIKYLKSTQTVENFNGVQGVSFKLDMTDKLLPKAKTLFFDVQSDYNLKIRIQIEYKKTDGTNMIKTLKEIFILPNGEQRISVDFMPIADDSINYNEANLRIIQIGMYPAPFILKNWSLKDKTYKSKRDDVVIDSDEPFYYDVNKFTCEHALKNGIIWNRVKLKGNESGVVEVSRILSVIDATSSTVEPNEYFDTSYTISSLVRFKTSATNTLAKKDKIDIIVNYCDRLDKVLQARTISSFYTDSSNPTKKIACQWTPFRNDIALVGLHHIKFVLKGPEMQTNEVFEFTNFEVIQNNKDELTPYFIKSQTLNAYSKSNLYENGVNYNRLRIDNPADITGFSDCFIYQINNYNKKDFIKSSFKLKNDVQAEKKYQVQFYFIDESGIVVDSGVTRRIRILGNTVENVELLYTLCEYTSNLLIVLKITQETDGVSTPLEMRYTTPSFEILSYLDNENLLSEYGSSYINTGENDFVIRQDRLGGSKLLNIRFTKNIAELTEHDKEYGRGVFFPLYNPSDYINKKLVFSGSIFSFEKQMYRFYVSYRKKGIENAIVIDHKIGEVFLQPNETFNFSYDFIKKSEIDLDECKAIYFSVRTVPNLDGVFSLNCYDLKLKIANNLKEVTTKTEGHLPKFRINGDLTGINKDNKKDVTVDFVNGDTTLTYFATVKWQGDSSLLWDKKSYRLDFFEDETRKVKMKIPIIPHEKPLNSINLKANYIDWLSINNNIVSRYHATLTMENNETYHNRLKTAHYQEQCLFFGCEIYLNGSYNGVYTCSTKKSDAIDVDKGNPNEYALQGVAYNDYTAFKMDEAIFDEEVDFEEIDGTLTDDIKDSFNALMRLVNSASDTDFKAQIETKVNVQSIANVLLVNIMCGNRDCFGKNTVWQTFDGVEWYAVSYDHDLAFGTGSNVSLGYISHTEKTIEEMMSKNKLVERLIKTKILIPHLLTATALFKKLIPVSKMINDVNEEVLKIGSYDYIKNARRWSQQPYTAYYDTRDLQEYILKRYNLASFWLTENYLNNL